MEPSLDALVKNLSNNDFNYLSQKFSGDLLKLVKQKFKKFFEDQLPSMCEFFSYLRDECISERDYSHTINV